MDHSAQASGAGVFVYWPHLKTPHERMDLVTVLGVQATDPWPGQAEASLIPVMGPLKVQSINSDRGDDSFLAVNVLLSAAQGVGLGLALYELFSSSPVTDQPSQSSLGLSLDGQRLTLFGRF